MKRYGIALDIGTSGFRCQAIDLDSKKTVSTAITARHPIPGMNVIDHVNFAMDAGPDVGNGLMIKTINKLFKLLDIDLSKVEIIAACGNPFQLSLFQNIEIRDLAYAGKSMLKTLGVVSPPRDGDILNAKDMGIEGMPNAKVMIPPAVTHEIGADAVAMLMMTDILQQKEPCIVVDYGTNAEMALVVDGRVYTGSAAAGPALEGQQIERGMLAAPGAISDINMKERGWEMSVLDKTIEPKKGDIVDPITGNSITEGEMHRKAIGITGTGVVAAIACGMNSGYIDGNVVSTPDSKIHLQNGIDITSADVDEAGKAIGALRAGFLTLLREAGLWVNDVDLAYMSGASGLYVDAKKAQAVGMVVPCAHRIVQFGNTSIGMARKMVLGEISLDELKEFSKKLRASHCMFATSEDFKNIYSIEISLWSYGMPMSAYNDMMDVYELPHVPENAKNVEITRMTTRDLPDIDDKGIIMLENSGIMLKGVLKGCISCGLCISGCPESAIEIENVGGEDILTISSDKCGGTACRRCELNCTKKIISFKNLTIEG